jgi:hypothetical protein
MGDFGTFALRGLAGGVLVVVFALVGEIVSPKAFSGLFSSAPSVAVASLAITIVAEGTTAARENSIGMVVGALAMTACCILAAAAIPRLRSVAGSILAWVGWGGVAFGLYWAVFVGAR